MINCIVQFKQSMRRWSLLPFDMLLTSQFCRRTNRALLLVADLYLKRTCFFRENHNPFANVAHCALAALPVKKFLLPLQYFDGYLAYTRVSVDYKH